LINAQNDADRTRILEGRAKTIDDRIGIDLPL
jgi:hypothetical protein